MKRIAHNLMLLPALIISICLSYSCKERLGELEGYEDYPLVQYMREHGWVGMGDSTFCYPQDSVLYNGLKVDGKSLQEVELLYGEPRYCVNYTIRYGIPQRFLETNPLFPLTYQRAEVPILYAEWVITDKVNLIIFFENNDNKTKAIYGIQFRFNH
ncbi:hypothetical protein [Muribaculum intestinale]|uniref:hypothetical protein n=1 Tax=Muribaculum intestinale TaxID=1796646 RepID=UPI0025AF0F6C|nr:hypothetical protein [Muribaculum intestinale]